MAGKSYIKTGDYSWNRIKKMYIKTGGQTWTAIRKAYIKVSESGTRWRKVYDTASNRPFIANNDIPKIRLNTFRTNSTYNPSGTANDPVNPVVEAPPVQQMGPPTTTPTAGWPNESIGNHLWGYDGGWVSGNGSTITYTYQWLYNFSGDPNDNTFDPAFSPEYSSTTSASNTSSTGRSDMLTNTSTYLGRNDGDYFDRNFLTFRVRATNSAGVAAAESTQVYIVRQRPTGTVTMVLPNEASPNTTMSATFTYSDSWYNKADTAESYVEWFAVDNLGDTLTTLNRVQIEYLNTFSPTGTTTKTATTYHVPTLTNKYYYARITLNNSNTLPAKYAGNVITISGFTPNSAFTTSANKTSKTASTNGAFNLTNATKTSRFYDSGTSLFQRYVSVDIGQSSGATQYEVQIEGQYAGGGGTYDTSTSAWTILQTLDAAPYVYESSRSGGILTYTKAVTNYKNYRLTARSRNGTSLNGAAYSNGGTSSSYQYVTAPDVAPSAPSISFLSTSSDSYGGVYITFNVSQSSNGSNDWDYYEYSLNNGAWTKPVTGPFFGNGYINTSSGKIYVNAGTYYTIQIRLTNLDGVTSTGSNTLSITSASIPTAPTNVIIKSFVANTGHIFLTSGSNTQSIQGYLEYDSVTTFDSITNYINIGSNTPGVISLTGANSTSRTYTAYTQPFSGTDKTGYQGLLTTHSTKVLNGSDSMTVSLNTPTRGSDPRTLTFTWNLTAGSPSYYRVRLYDYYGGYVVSTQTIQEVGTSAARSATFTSSDGVGYGTVYYAQVTPYYQYAAGVTYENFLFASNNITSGSAATKLATPTGISASTNRTDGILISWNNVSNAATYGVWWGGTPGYDSAPDFGGPNNNGGKTIVGSPFLDDVVSAGTTRDYYVQAFPASGSTSFLKSDWSSGASGTRLTAPVKLATPTGVNASDTRSDGVLITWNAVSGAAYYGVWWGGAPGYDSLADFGGNRNTTLITGTSYLDTAISSGSSRDYYVQAYKSGDPSGTKSDWGGPDNGTRVAANVITYSSCYEYSRTTDYNYCIGYARSSGGTVYNRRDQYTNGSFTAYVYDCANTTWSSYDPYGCYTPPQTCVMYTCLQYDVSDPASPNYTGHCYYLGACDAPLNNDGYGRSCCQYA